MGTTGAHSQSGRHPSRNPVRVLLGTAYFFGEISINNSGSIAFTGIVKGEPAGVFLITDGKLQMLARVGEEMPGKPGARYSGFSRPILNNSGTVVYWASESETHSTALFLYEGGTVRLLVSEGSVPETHKDLTIISISNHDLNDAGDVIFSATAFSERLGNTRAVFLLSTSSLKAVAVPGTYSFLVSPSQPRFSSQTEAYFLDRSSGGLLASRSRERLFSVDLSGAPNPILPKPSVAGEFANLESVSIARAGGIAVIGQLADGSSALEYSDGASRQLITPGHSLGDRPDLMFVSAKSIRLNNNGSLAALVRLDQERAALMLSRDGSVRTLLVTGEPLAGSGSPVVSEISRFDINDDGTVLALLTLEGKKVLLRIT